jgi:hypothetical protein
VDLSALDTLAPCTAALPPPPDRVADTEIGGVRKIKGGTGDKSGSRCRWAGAGPGTRRRSRLSSVMATPSRNESVLVQVRSVFCSWVRERSRAPVRLAT